MYPESKKLSVFVESEDDTVEFGKALSVLLDKGDIIALQGTLGSGKSVLARSIIRALCGQDEEVPSPTFTLAQLYQSNQDKNLKIWHFDLYRLEVPEEVFELGMDEAWTSGGVSLIEWPHKIGGYMPLVRLDISIDIANNKEGKPLAREVRLVGYGADWIKRLEMLEKIKEHA